MREMATIPPVQDAGGREIPFHPLPKAQRGGNAPAANNPAVVQNWMGPDVMPAPIASFDGVDNQTTISPPDTEGDIGYDPATGSKYYFQWVNLWYAIWDVTDPANPVQVYPPGGGFANGSTPWIGFGGYCEATNDGDPIVLFDPLAQRWFMSQFALPNYPSGPFGVCIAVSQTADPTGAWYRYAYDWVDEFGGDVMNDYPKFGVWPDAYYMTVNQFYGSSPNCSGTWCGAGVAAFERDQMLLGNPAQMVAFDLAGTNINFGGQLPADLDGLNPPPPGAPGYFFEWDDGTWIGPQDAIRVWEFDVDWATPANSTFGVNGQPNLVIPTSNVNPNAANVPQPGTVQTLDVIADRLMVRAAYRNFGDYEALVTNRTNTSGGVAAPYWFELRKSGGGPWTLYQEGLYAPGDGDHRWMGSIAQDRMGNMALGYSVSSGSTYPSIRYTGRLVGDPLGTMPQGEAEFVAGGGSQISSDRWGDYSMMGIDPVDDCTFWYTQEYYPANSGTHWYTRIGAFKFPSCSIGATGVLSGTITDSSTTAPIVGATIQATGLLPTHTGSTASGAGGVYSMILPVDIYTVTTSAYGYISNTVGGVDIFSDTPTIVSVALDPATMYVVAGVVSDTLTGWPLYASIDIAPQGLPGTTIWNDPVSGYYSVTLPAAGITHTLTANPWVPGYNPEIRQIAPLTGDRVEDLGLNADVAACKAPGYSPIYAYVEDLEASDGGYTHTGTWDEWEWGTPTVWPNDCASGSNCWGTDLDGNYENYASQALTSTLIDLTGVPSGTIMIAKWWQALSIESSTWDRAYAEVSINGGVWTEMWSHTGGTGQTDWTEMDYDISAAAGGNVQFRWRHTSDGLVTYGGYYIDDVNIALGCDPTAGGLMVGNVYDDNLGDPLLGAEVSNEDGYVAISELVPDDPAVEDGFYTIFSPSGSKTFTATLANYGPDVHIGASVFQSETVGLEDFYLPAGLLDYTPGSLKDTVELGLSSTLSLTLENLGGTPVYFEFAEGDRGVAPLGPVQYVEVTIPGAEVIHGPDARVTKRKFTYRPEINFTVEKTLVSTAGIEVLLLTPDADTSLIETTLAAFSDLNVTKWPGGADPTAGDLLPYQVVIVGNDYTWGAAGMTQTGVGDALAGYIDAGGKVIDTLFVHDYFGWELSGRYITDGYAPFTTSTTDFSAIPYYLGTVYDPAHPIMSGVTTISDNPTIGYSHQDVGLAPGATRLADWDDGEVFIAYNDNVVGINQMWYQGSNWTGNVPELMHNAILYSVFADVDWLATDPISGTLGIADQQVISVTLDASAPSVTGPGNYKAMLNLRNDTPYGQPGIPVTMTVVVPASYGELEGIVSSQGYCDVNPAALSGADVLIEDSIGMTWTATTGISGTYSYWLDAGGYTVTAFYADHISKTVVVSITNQMTTTQDFDLRILQPCVAGTPLSMGTILMVGASDVQTLTLTNDGAAASFFEIEELLVDVPWLSEDPITGTVGAESFFDVSITFTALSTMTRGTYFATLIASTGNPVTPTINIPVTMTVVAAPACGFTSSSPDELGQTTYFTNTTTGDMPMSYYWDFGDRTSSGAISPTHVYTQAGWYAVVLTATNQRGQDVCSGGVA
ncbi:MAG: carboxypeptidase regulatory-like domain-containing protein, partial [Anaerolineae bacterium]